MASHPPSPQIVVVENTPHLSLVLEGVPNKQYSAISSASSARECLESLCDAVFLVDLMLEDMDGLSLIEEIRIKKPYAPVIAFIPAKSSAQLELEEKSLRKMAVQSGANALFIAPFNLGEITGTIDRLALQAQPEAVA